MDDNVVFPVRRPDVVVREIEGETLVLDSLSGKVHQFNTAAGFIWACCDGTSSIVDITRRLAAQHSSQAVTLELDVANTIGKFQELGLLMAPGINNLQKEGSRHVRS